MFHCFLFLGIFLLVNIFFCFIFLWAWKLWLGNIWPRNYSCNTHHYFTAKLSLSIKKFSISFFLGYVCFLLQLTGETVGEVKAVADMHQRKAEMAKHSDAFIALPGEYNIILSPFPFALQYWWIFGKHNAPLVFLFSCLSEHL